MKLDVVFREQEQSFDAQFEAIQNVSDGGYERGYADGYDKGKQDGYSDGYNVGFPEGKAEGLAAGIEQGYANGYAAGYDAGYAEGYATGYAKGKLEGNPPDSEVLDPDEVYRTTRPKDWLPMPTPGDDEIYILCHVRPNRKGMCAVKVLSSGDVSVEYGWIKDGAFVADGVVSADSSSNYALLLNPSMCYSETLSGDFQCLVRIKGAITALERAVIAPVARQSAVDIACGVALQHLRLGDANLYRRTLFDLRYFRFTGNGGVASLENGFYLCRSLLCVTCEKPNIISGSLLDAFVNCEALVAVSPNLISGSVGAVNASYMFSKCNLNCVANFSFACSSITNMFNASNVLSVDFTNIDTSSCKNAGAIFHNIYVIRSIKNLNISSITTMESNWMANASALETLTFAGETTPGNITINVQAPMLSHDALVEMIESLPVALEPATITITEVLSASELTDDEIAVANAKNWTIAI